MLADLLRKNLAAKLISVVIAIMLWSIVLGSRNIEVTKDVPIDLAVPEGLVASNDVPKKISFRLSGPKAFLRAILDRPEKPIRVNLMGAKSGLVTYRFFSDNIRLPIGVKVQSITPSAIIVKLEKESVRNVPVRVELRGRPPEGYKVIETKIEPKTVRIKGPKTKIGSISEVFAKPIDVSDLKVDLNEAATFDLSQMAISLSDDPPIVTVKIEAQKSNFRIRNVKIKTLADLKSKMSKKSVTVFVKATAEQLKNLDQSKIYAELDARGKKKGRHRLPVVIRLPNEIGLVKVVPEKVAVTLF